MMSLEFRIGNIKYELREAEDDRNLFSDEYFNSMSENSKIFILTDTSNTDVFDLAVGYIYGEVINVGLRTKTIYTILDQNFSSIVDSIAMEFAIKYLNEL